MLSTRQLKIFSRTLFIVIYCPYWICSEHFFLILSNYMLCDPYGWVFFGPQGYKCQYENLPTYKMLGVEASVGRVWTCIVHYILLRIFLISLGNLFIIVLTIVNAYVYLLLNRICGTWNSLPRPAQASSRWMPIPSWWVCILRHTE